MRLIGISGKAGSGKDHVGRLLSIARDYKCFSFAHALKLEAIAHGFSHEEVFVTKPPFVRQWLQRYGVEQRKLDSEIWIRRAFQIIHIMGWKKVVFTDVRFPNEAAAILASGPRARLLRIDPQDRPYPLAGTPEAEHISETALDDFPGFMIPIENGLSVSDSDLLAQLAPVIQ